MPLKGWWQAKASEEVPTNTSIVMMMASEVRSQNTKHEVVMSE